MRYGGSAHMTTPEYLRKPENWNCLLRVSVLVKENNTPSSWAMPLNFQQRIPILFPMETYAISENVVSSSLWQSTAKKTANHNSTKLA